MQFQEKPILKENWWLMWCSFPNLNWARLRANQVLQLNTVMLQALKLT
jgi:hypothetical protein